MRRILVLALVLAGSGHTTRADDPPTPVPVPKSPPRPAPLPAHVGVRWEREFDAGMRRAVDEGRPVFVAVNALVDEGEAGNAFLWRETYASKAMGSATRSFVNFVANPTAHAIDREPDGSEICRRYRVGTCLCHQDAMRWVLRHLASTDGAIISPYHAVLDPDGRIVYRGEYMQSCPTHEALEAYLVELSPRHALRDVWTTREAKLDALAKVAAADLESAAVEWLDTKDPMAVAGLVALWGQERDFSRCASLRAVLAKAGPSALSVIEDAVDAATATPDADAPATSAWIELALKVDPAFGALAAARAILRTTSADHRRRWTGIAESVLGKDFDAPTARDEVRRRRRQSTDEIAHRRSDPTATGPSRDALRSDLFDAAQRGLPFDRAHAIEALARPEEELRVAAALALRVAGDYRGAEILRAAIGDPVEGPEVRSVLSKLAGGDRGDDADAWTDVLTEPAKGSIK